jgi:hypothetical protein
MNRARSRLEQASARQQQDSTQQATDQRDKTDADAKTNPARQGLRMILYLTMNFHCTISSFFSF